MAKLPDGRALPGKLFIVEGIDGLGKSTQLDVLRKWLIGRGYLVAFSERNSSPSVRKTTRRGKKKQLLTPTSFSLVHAADFSDRMERQMLPALKAGAIVLADRYVHTAFARDVARGVHRQWVRSVYSFAIQPTVAFYFHVPMDESLQRIAGGRPTLKYYEAGLDLGLCDDPFESCRLFKGRILEEYAQMVEEFGLTVIDATLPLLEQHELVREAVEPYLGEALRSEPVGWRDVLAAESLQGRHRDEIRPAGDQP